MSYYTLKVNLPNEIYAVFDALGYQQTSESSPFTSISGIFNLFDGPLVIPTFDEYILASKYIQKYNTGAQSRYVSQTTFGISYANLYTTSAIHFVPDNDLSKDLIKFLHRTTTTSHTLQYHVHDSEGEAVTYILNHLEERTLVLIVLNEISLGKVDYTLRFNYSTLPNTNQVVNLHSLGFDSNYQKYIISGYMTIQDTVDRWVFDYLGLARQGGIGDSTYIGECSKPYPFLIAFPIASYYSNPFYSSIGFLLGLAMTSKS